MFENATKKNRFIYLLQVMIFALFISGCNMQTEAVIKVSSTQVHVGESVAFDASKSSGGKGKIVSYVWKDASGSILSKNVTFNHAFAQAGKHTVSLIVANDLNESSKATVEINVSMNDTDTIPPVITLKGDANITLKVGDTYTEAGATAVDDRDGNVSVDVSGSVDTSKVGTYTLTYTAKDKANNTSQKSRVVHVALPTDTTPPVITLKGDANITLKVGDSYIEAGATAIDDRDGNVSVDVNGTVDVNTTGVYIITYIAADKAGNKSQKERTVNVQDANNTAIEELKELLNDPSVPYTTDADFNKTEYAKHHLADDEAKRLERAHMLVATAKDPDPEWFYTDVDKSVIVTDAGTEHTITLKKMRKDGTVYAPVDNDKLRLVVRIQRSKDEFEYITNVNIDQYAHWDGAGILKINVPQDLDKGRMIVGVRPNFDDVATAAIAERWSALITAEVWQIKSGVQNVNSENVLFPINDASLNYMSAESKFTRSEISDKRTQEMANNQLFTFAIVVKNMNLKKGDMLAYIFNNSPRSGKVIYIEHRDNQDFVLLSPELFEIYDIADIDNSSMIDQGVSPENVIIREGGQLETDQNESDPTKFEKRSLQKKSLGKVVDLFAKHCNEGDSLLTFKINPSLSPLDLGIDVGVVGLKKETKCTYETTGRKIPIRPSYFGGVGALVLRAMGAKVELELYGKIELVTKNALGFGFDAGYSIQKGGHFKDVSTKKNLGSRNLEDDAATGEGEVSMGAGIKMTIVGISLPEFAQNNFANDLGLEVSVGLKDYITALAKNATEVKKNSSSEYAIKADVEIDPKLTTGIKNVFTFFHIDISLERENPYSIALVTPSKGVAEFLFNSVSDQGQGSAHIVGLHAKYDWMNRYLSSSYEGVLSLDNSSVFNQKSEAIEYSQDECAQNPDYKIVSPAIACAGWMCGVVKKDVVLCKGKLTISDTIASARVGRLASIKSTIVNNAGDIKVNISGSPLEPKTKSLEMKAGTKAEVVFEKVCPNEPGVYRKKKYSGKSTVVVEGTHLSAESLNIMTCYKDENKGDPHITTGDGLGYDYFASGDYILSRILDENGTQVSGYEIQARFLPGFKTSWPQAVALNVGGDRIEIQGLKTDGHGNGSGVKINALSIWVNGKKYFEKSAYSSYQDNNNLTSKIIKLPAGGIIAITQTKSSNVLHYPTSMTIIWPEGSAAENYGLVVNVADAPNQPFIETLIARPDDFAGQERGLLGNNDGNPKNDFIRRNGEVLGVDHNMSFTELYALFGTDWLARPYESLFRNPEAIKPQFPTDVVTLTPEQRALGEEACRALTGFYREACIMDVGLTGSAEIVKEYYANTEDLNDLSDAIVVPDVDKARYTMNVGDKSYEADSGYYLHCKQDINISQTAGKGKFMLLVRPPRGATVMLGTGESSHTDEGNFSTTLEVDCTQQNSSTDSEFLQKDGAVQLWLQDPLSGTAQEMVSQEPLVCTDASKRAGFSLNLGTRDEKADSNDTNLHYTQPLSITHTNSYAGAYILALTPPSNGAVLTLNGSATELNVTGSGDYNATIELDCTQVVYDADYRNGSINLWEKDKLSGQKSYLYGSINLSCKKAKLLKTGQTTSYADFDDGYYQKGAERSYSRDDAKEIVTDNVTQLQWQDNAEAKTVTKTWQGAKDYCAALDLGGYSDWRLPNRKELLSIVDLGRYSPSLNPEFLNFVSNYYWSSTTDANYSSLAWLVRFNSGYQYDSLKRYYYYVRCVRAGQ